MREWLSGIASPCQGEGRGFDSRFALPTREVCDEYRIKEFLYFFIYSLTNLQNIV